MYLSLIRKFVLSLSLTALLPPLCLALLPHLSLSLSLSLSQGVLCPLTLSFSLQIFSDTTFHFFFFSISFKIFLCSICAFPQTVFHSLNFSIFVPLSLFLLSLPQSLSKFRSSSELFSTFLITYLLPVSINVRVFFLFSAFCLLGVNRRRRDSVEEQNNLIKSDPQC